MCLQFIPLQRIILVYGKDLYILEAEPAVFVCLYKVFIYRNTCRLSGQGQHAFLSFINFFVCSDDDIIYNHLGCVLLLLENADRKFFITP